MQVLRKELTANTDTNFEFEKNGTKFLVKNFTDEYILVKLCPCDDTIKIPSMCSQVVTANLIAGYNECSNKLIINSIAGGEVEAQCIEY